MSENYLEATYKKGRAIAAYSCLPRRAGKRSFRTEEFALGILLEFSRGGKAIGNEITDPAGVTFAAMNRVLTALDQSLMSRGDLAPLKAA